MADSLVIDNGRTEPFWISYIRGRIVKKKNFLVQISGPTGSGKSWTALSVASMLDKNFTTDRIVFGFRGLMKLINSSENYPPGSTFVWDEFQVEGSARNWQSLTNKLLNSLLSTFRHRCFVLIITAPYLDFIDSSARKLLHAEWQTMSIDYSKDTTKIKPQLIQYNARRKQYYYKYLRVATKLGVAPLKIWNIPRPPQNIVEQYEKMKSGFTSALNQSIEAQLTEIEPQPKQQNRKPLTQKQELCMKLMARYHDVHKIEVETGMNSRTIYFHMKQGRGKGYTIEEFKENNTENNDYAMENTGNLVKDGL